VPAYFYPRGHETEWRMLASGLSRLRYVVVNPHDGPGETTDPAYEEVVDRLHLAHVQVIGYIDTDYGRRPVADLISEARAYRERYAVTGIFLDQAASDIDHLTLYDTYVVGLRTVGVRFVVLNPGTYPNAGYFRLANQIVTFEGSWEQYRELEVPEWSLRIPKRRIAHYVWAVPPSFAASPADAVGERHVGTVALSTDGMPHPWGTLPPALRAQAARRVGPAS
jgi:Spherulation-specific family 4